MWGGLKIPSLHLLQPEKRIVQHAILQRDRDQAREEVAQVGKRLCVYEARLLQKFLKLPARVPGFCNVSVVLLTSFQTHSHVRAPRY